VTPEDNEAIREVNRQAFGREDEPRLVDALRDGGYARGRGRTRVASSLFR
jgi:predicted N-acetyltransferase YhbS